MPSVHQSGDAEDRTPWAEKVICEYDEMTARACIRGVRHESVARQMLGVCNREGVGGWRKRRVVERVRDLADD